MLYKLSFCSVSRSSDSAMKNKRRDRPRKTPKQARAQETVEAILVAAARIFRKHGYADATTNRIAEAAGVSIGSLYEYFPSKDALLVSLADRHMNEGMALVMQLLAEGARDNEPLDAWVRRAVDAMIELHMREPELHRVLFEESPLPARLRASLEDLESTLVSSVEMLLRSRDDVRVRDVGLSARILVRTVESLTHDFVLRRRAPDDRATFVAEVAQLVTGYLTFDRTKRRERAKEHAST
jgi:AcrR family transcriptional regulator